MVRAILFLVTGVSVAAAGLPEKGRQILDRHCVSCHGPAKMAGLDLRQRDAAIRGGGRGPAVVPGKPAASLLIQAVERQGAVAMPPGKKGLDPAEIATLRQWVESGFEWPASTGAAEPSWWSFRKLQRSAVPTGASNPVDAFVAARLRDKKLTPVPLADRRTLIRRAYFDLHGLPAPVEEIERFEKDEAPDAWAKVVDKLLESPRYGERWGRHWLDVVRYADTGGFETDIYFPNAWRYRDYVIKSFNDDKPFDAFIREQVAGDEIWPGSLDLEGGFKIPDEKQRKLEARIGTGMYTIGPVYHEAALFGGQQRYEWLSDVVDTTGEAFLGLTLGCSRCHDHKFDPLTSRDYHAMMAVFATSDEREVPVIAKFNIYGYKSGYPNWLKVEEIKGQIARIEQGPRKRAVDRVRARFDAAALAAFDKPEKDRAPDQRALAAKVEEAMTEAGLKENAKGRAFDSSYTADEQTRRDKLIRELGEAALRANPVMQTATVLGPADEDYKVHLTARGDWRSKGEEIGPALPAALDAERRRVDPVHRRKSLAEWLATHPLPARVMANRVWHWHFGRGIVATPNDFGRQGDEPSHPELLEWLAAEFAANGYRVKALHRLIMTSETYRRSSAANAENARIDAGNVFLWRANRRRLESEALRDAVLAASGSLNTKMGGRPVIPVLSPEEYSTMWARNQWPESMDEKERDRRGVYLYVKRSFAMPMMTAFDSPDPSVSCARRDSTNVAPQALTLMNGAFTGLHAHRMAERIAKQAAAPEWAGRAFRMALGREPSAAERGRASQVLGPAPDEAALARLCLVLFNTNEFVYVD